MEDFFMNAGNVMALLLVAGFVATGFKLWQQSREKKDGGKS